MMADILALPFAGLVISAGALALTIAVCIIGLRHRRKPWGALAGATGALGALLATGLLSGSVLYEIGSRRELATFPRPGVMIDVGGYRLHVVCEGEASPDRPTVVWISGGYAPGLALNHLHSAWRMKGRSCWIDRAGVGWSDAGPEPRSVKTIVREFHTALSGSGETPRYLLVGHSLGGMIAANWAARYPEEIAGVITLDPTPHEMIATGGVRRPGGWCGAPPAAPIVAQATFGLGYLMPWLHPMNSEGYRRENAALSAELPALKALESRPSARRETLRHFEINCYSGYETIRHPGALGSLPLRSIVQRLKTGEEERKTAERWSGVSDDLEWEIYKRSMRAAADEYPRLSSRGELVFLPDDWGHNFPLTHADYVLAQVTEFIDEIRTPEIDPATPEPGAETGRN
ncbi:MAG: alpha/beta hydrolase [Alphaproteobacteria bacterium]|nr:alpha/beta hydrolase [Alphaproteobacteria bacterium]